MASDSPSTDAMLEALARGDRQAAEQMVEETYGEVYGALYRLVGGDADLAADLCQEAYRKAWTALPRFRGRSQLSTWLYRIAYNTFLNHIRRPRPLQPPEEAAAALVDPAASIEARLGQAGENERLRRAVLGLPEELRYTVTAHYWGELPVRRIAEEAGVTTVAIRKRLKRAFERLSLALAEDY